MLPFKGFLLLAVELMRERTTANLRILIHKRNKLEDIMF